MNRPEVLDAALDARDPYHNDRDYPQPEAWADGANPLARPHPHLPWIERCLPARSAAFGIGARAYPYRHVVDYGGHEPTVHDFPVTPPPETVARRVSVERPERIA